MKSGVSFEITIQVLSISLSPCLPLFTLETTQWQGFLLEMWAARLAQ